MQHYRQVHGRFPPPYTVDEKGNRLHSWRTLILPYLERDDLFESIHFDEPWDSEHNRKFAATAIWAYRCPSRVMDGDEDPNVRADYVMITGPGTVGMSLEGTRLEDITDAHDGTVLVAEVARSNIQWMEPRDYDFAAGPHRPASRPGESRDTVALGSDHPRVVNVVMVDTSVKSVPVNIDEKTFKALMTIAGGEEVELE